MGEVIEINNPTVTRVMPRIVDIKNASIFHDKHLVLENVNFEVRKGDFIYLIGKTGSGKSSLLKTLYGDLEFTKGDADVCGYNLKNIKRTDVPYLRRRLGIVFQDFQLLSDRTVFENLAFMLQAIGWIDKNKIKNTIQDALERVKLSEKIHKMPNQLSGGEQQRVTIARALLNNPELILADEPTGNLDPETTTEIMDLFYSIFKETQTPMVFATHNYQLIEQYPGIIYMCAYNSISRDDSHFQRQ
ncbi:MAG TPA: ATP-binding cassette domain-containing protein [Chitinophagales bacterium]|jgi:cell division transport system ATP-binding protein|nr:ATP-binding cassette domain-containing protein [Chitinophagales bacterium]MBP6154422.1 ATP-binding cassette domain-containing protein [Chitinophagales bacterium]HQV78984.1 ATP-binding cassette domain-containing protein [Chitinophagales bacterium]HQW79974.1 ATP-binding cassette domain-containing protein [Chitinophagales bacterium]HRB67729.1 ATP-binding cassette domain-containing protein [Chitinophagales bacterium]